MNLIFSITIFILYIKNVIYMYMGTVLRKKEAYNNYLLGAKSVYSRVNFNIYWFVLNFIFIL